MSGVPQLGIRLPFLLVLLLYILIDVERVQYVLLESLKCGGLLTLSILTTVDFTTERAAENANLRLNCLGVGATVD